MRDIINILYLSFINIQMQNEKESALYQEPNEDNIQDFM